MILPQEKPPQNLEAERALLGCLILDNRQVDAVLEVLPAAPVQDAIGAVTQAGKWRPKGHALFYSPAHQVIFGQICSLVLGGAGVDLTVLANALHERGLLEAVGGAAYLAGLEDDIYSFGQVPEYARIVAEHWRRRGLREVGQEMGAAALDTARPIGEVLARAEQRLFELAAERQRGDLEQISQAVVDRLAEIEAVSTGQQESGLKTGFKELDRRTSGFKPGQMIVIAARPSVGKSAFATNIAQHVALTLRRSVGFFEVEMAKGELIGRMLSGAAHIPFGIIQGHYRLSRAERDALHEAGEALAQAPLFIDDSDTLTPTDLRSKARKLKTQRPDLALIVVDYLGLMETGGKSENSVGRKPPSRTWGTANSSSPRRVFIVRGLVPLRWPVRPALRS